MGKKREYGTSVRRGAAHWSGLLGMAGMAIASQGTAWAADVSLPPISIGAGMQTSFDHETTGGSSGTSSNRFNLDSIRLYINGGVNDWIKFTFDTEYTPQNNVQVLDALARFEYSPSLNIWAGRFLPPTDRANLYGPYYANNMFPYKDGVADFYPSVAVGRDNGVAYWGQFGMVKLSLGAFDGPSATGVPGAGAGNKKLLTAARVMVDLWDPEPGYYLNGTYYGEKDVLAFGVAGQHQADDTQDGGNRGGTSYSLDGLMEKNLGSGLGVVDVEAEYQHDSGLINQSNGWYTLGSYLFAQTIGVGKFQILGKYSSKTTHSAAGDVDDKTKEVDLNYVIKGFNARVGMFYLDYTDPVAPYKMVGMKLQLQI